MLSQPSLNSIRRLIKGGQILRISIFSWDTSTSQAFVIKSKLTWVVVITMAVYLLFQFAFEVCQIYRLADDPEEPFTNYMKMIVQCSTRMFGLLMTIDSCVNGEQRACFVNQILELNKRFKGVEGGRKLKDTVKTISRVIVCIAFGYPVLACTGFLEDRYQSRYWHHLVIPSAIFPFTLPLICVLEYLITAQNLQVCIFYLSIATIYFRSASAWMTLIMRMDKSPGVEWETDCLVLFRTMQVYNKIYNNRIAALWTYQMATVFLLQTQAFVNTIRLTHIMSFPTNLMFPVTALCSCYFSTVIYKATTVATDMSQDLAKSFKDSKDKYNRLLGDSMRPLYVEVRPFFVMEKTTSFAFTNEVVDKTISVLLI